LSVVGPIAEVTVASRDVARHARFLAESFGFEPVAAAGPGLLLGVAGVSAGRIRLVPAGHDPVVAEPLGWEPGPRLLAIRSRDVAATRRRFEAAGGRCGPTVTYEHPETQNQEFVGRGPDDVLWAVAFAVGGPGSPEPQRRPSPALETLPQRTETELFSVVCNVTSLEPGRALARALGWRTLLDFPMDGAHIEDVLGLPSGTALDFWMGAAPGNAPARLEMMHFRGVPARDFPARAVGIRRATIDVDDDPAQIAASLGCPIVAPGVVAGPGGLEIEFRARKS
jgi:hypothetical protein